MTAIPSDPGLGRAVASSGGATDEIQREMLSLRARVRALAEKRAGVAADRFTQELQVLAQTTAREMAAACEDRAILSRLHGRLSRQVNADLLRARDDDDSVDARARALFLARLDGLLDTPRNAIRPTIANVAHADLSPGAARALRIFEQHREMVRSCFRGLKRRVQTELADLSLEMAGETAARLCLRFGRQGQEWLWWRLSRIVDQFVAVSRPAGLPASLELLATRSVLSGLEKTRKS